MTDDQLLYAIGSANLDDELCDFRVPVATVTADDKSAVLGTFRDRKDDGGDKVLRVVFLLKDLDFLTETRSVRGGVSMFCLCIYA